MIVPSITGLVLNALILSLLVSKVAKCQANTIVIEILARSLVLLEARVRQLRTQLGAAGKFEAN